MKFMRKNTVDIDTLDSFTRAYIECALWSSNDESTPESGVPMDENYTIEDLSPECIGQMIADCAKFQKKQSALLKSAYTMPPLDEDAPLYSPSQAGHDFWLTRCGHGAGFWDRGLGGIGEALSQLCGHGTDFNNIDLYIGDDKAIHGA